MLNQRKVFITGTAGFVGFHVALQFIQADWIVLGADNLSDYYDVNLKRARLEILAKSENFEQLTINLENITEYQSLVLDFRPDVIIHLAAQAGVRYSIENPRSYVDSNLIATFNILEIARSLSVRHLLLASTSSAYGANTKVPFSEIDKCTTPMSFYAATKLATEAMSHSYAHLFNIPTTVFRFFTVYGPWGRPDMALFKFVKAMLNNDPIDIYNHGEMKRDFTFVSDLAKSITLLADVPPADVASVGGRKVCSTDSISDIAPWRLVNIGNAQTVKLLQFVTEIEDKLGVVSSKRFMDMQAGDVPETFADNSLLKSLIGFSPNTSVRDGISAFVDWYLDFYGDGEGAGGMSGPASKV